MSINLVVLVVILLLDCDNFFVRVEVVLVPVLSVPLEETLFSCPSDVLQSVPLSRGALPCVGRSL